MTIHEALNYGFVNLKKAGIDSYQLDTELLLVKALLHPRKPNGSNFLPYARDMDRTRVYQFSRNQEIKKSNERRFRTLIQQRVKRIPVAYLTNVKEFYDLPFYVDNNVLIPRPQTELLVEKTIHQLISVSTYQPTTIIDIGTGSGCIVISIAKKILRRVQEDKICLIATDVSHRALNIARLNARIHGVSKYIKYVETNALPTLKTKNLIVVANLPYLNPSLKSKLIRTTPELQYEPKTSLFAANHGLKQYLELIKSLRTYQKKRINVTCFFEIDPHQRVTLSKLIGKTIRGQNWYQNGIVHVHDRSCYLVIPAGPTLPAPYSPSWKK